MQPENRTRRVPARECPLGHLFGEEERFERVLRLERMERAHFDGEIILFGIASGSNLKLAPDRGGDAGAGDFAHERMGVAQKLPRSLDDLRGFESGDSGRHRFQRLVWLPVGFFLREELLDLTGVDVVAEHG